MVIRFTAGAEWSPLAYLTRPVRKSSQHKPLTLRLSVSDSPEHFPSPSGSPVQHFLQTHNKQKHSQVAEHVSMKLVTLEFLLLSSVIEHITAHWVFIFSVNVLQLSNTLIIKNSLTRTVSQLM